MKIKNLSAFIILAAVLCFTLSVSDINAQTIREKPASPPAPLLLTQKTIVGAWQLNEEESDDVPKKVAQMLQNSNISKKNTNKKQEELPAVSISLFPPEKLSLVTGNETEMTINEAYKEVTLSRTIVTDGAAHHFSLNSGTNISVKAFQKQNNLLVETTSPRGNKMTESFAVTPDGKKLNVTLRIVDPDSQEIITLHRVYNRSVLNIFSDAASGAEQL